MRLISKRNLFQAAANCPEDIQEKVKAWYNTIIKSKESESWNSLSDIRNTYQRSVDQVENFLIFNIKSYRLIVSINYKTKIIYFKYLLTHEEYDQDTWKTDK
ncbi:type II toxin-antitoxin system HigB family toxin [Cyanobacteria bacterium FACHB-63]|nr:type II toxin-antitoxin system HigB family toxin [Cyanobacteria bacterium FACHB-63]